MTHHNEIKDKPII